MSSSKEYPSVHAAYLKYLEILSKEARNPTDLIKFCQKHKIEGVSWTKCSKYFKLLNGEKHFAILANTGNANVADMILPSNNNDQNKENDFVLDQKTKKLYHRTRKKLKEIEILELKRKNGIKLLPNQIEKLNTKKEVKAKLESIKKGTWHNHQNDNKNNEQKDDFQEKHDFQEKQIEHLQRENKIWRQQYNEINNKLSEEKNKDKIIIKRLNNDIKSKDKLISDMRIQKVMLISCKEENKRLSKLNDELKQETNSLNKRVETYEAQKHSLNRLNMKQLNDLESKLFDSIKNIQNARLRLMENKLLCIICLDNNKNILIDPCNHIVLCSDCEKKMEQKICPLCRSAYTTIKRVKL